MTVLMNKIFKSYCKAKDGTIAILTAFALFVIVLVVAVAIDSNRLLQASTKLKALNDMAALAATEGEHRTLDERKAIFESVMAAGIANSPELSGYNYELTHTDGNNATVLSVTSRSEADLFFPITRGAGRFVSAHSEVTISREHIEVSLVLDISSSMRDARIAELKLAANSFVNSLLTNEAIDSRVSIAIVPYGGTVRLPPEFVNMLNQPETTEHWIDGKWNGCLSMRVIDYVTGITPQHRLNYMPDFTSYADKNPWCPIEGNELVPLTDNLDTLTDKIDNFTLSDGTGTDIGVAWGLATLDPIWRNRMPNLRRFAPRNYNARTKKIMVVMTDGGITRQNHPLDTQLVGDVPYETSNPLNSIGESRKGFDDICTLVKSKDIEVYTVGFQVNNSVADRLHDCGTSDGHNYEADLGSLTTVFQNIALSISGLRISL